MNRRVLSIQSSVVHGYVGNKAATLPLQMNNIEVDPFNTCQYSNHAGYPTFPGRRTEGDELNAVMKGRLYYCFSIIPSCLPSPP